MVSLVGKSAISFIVVLLLIHQDVEGTNDLIWKPYDSDNISSDCPTIAGQTNLYIGLVHVKLPRLDIEGYIPTTITAGFDYVNITINSKVYQIYEGDAGLQILCGISESDGILDFTSSSSDGFDSLFGTDREPIQVGWESYRVGPEENWYNASLYAGIAEFDSTADESHRVVVGKIYKNATSDLNNKVFLADSYSEIQKSTFDVLILNKQ